MRATIARGVAHFSYTPLLAAAAAVSFGKLIVYAGLLEVAQFGTFGKMLLVSTLFGMVGALGLQSVASRDVPALLVGGRTRRALRLLGQNVAVSAWVAAVGLIATAVGLSLFKLAALELALGIVHGWAQLAFLTAAIESRSRLQMMRYARDMAVRNAGIAIAGAAGAALGAGAALVIAIEIAGTVLCLFFVARGALRRGGIHPALLWRVWSVHRARLPWRSALAAGLGTLVMFASFNLDRWIAAETLSREWFGIYAFGWLALVGAQSVQGLLNSGLLPLLSRRRAEGHAGSAYRLTALMSAVTLTAGLAAAPTLAWLLPVALERWMPQYALSQPLWLPLLFAAVLRVSDFWSSLLLVLRQEVRLLEVQLAAVLVAALGFAAWLVTTASAVSPDSLAWLAVATAALSHAASAAMVISGQRRDVNPLS